MLLQVLFIGAFVVAISRLSPMKKHQASRHSCLSLTTTKKFAKKRLMDQQRKPI